MESNSSAPATPAAQAAPGTQPQIDTSISVPLGTRDFLPEQMALREKIFDTIKNVFKRHGAVTIDTPVFEYKDILMGKYGEDTKLIYDVEDAGVLRKLAMRYDLTVPFARFVAMHQPGNIKRYHIGRVYRRDNPVVSQGRYREFFQCDFDICGTYDPMLPEYECIKVLAEILPSLDVGPYVVKLNHRRLLDAMFLECGVPEDKVRVISSSVDKLDKQTWEEVRKEMIEVKGLDAAAADRIGQFVSLKGEPFELLDKLEKEFPKDNAKAYEDAQAALTELRTLFKYLQYGGILSNVRFDLSLARGLDYYTGVIYEAVLQGTLSGELSIGSIAAGGRYDNLVGSLCDKKVPTVGVSLGIDRLFDLLEQATRRKGQRVRAQETMVVVGTIGPNMIEHRLKLANLLWENDLRAEIMFFEDLKLANQRTFALEKDIPLLCFQGEDEVAKGEAIVRDLAMKSQETVKVADLVAYLKVKVAEVQARPSVAQEPEVAAPMTKAGKPKPPPTAPGTKDNREEKRKEREAAKAEKEKRKQEKADKKAAEEAAAAGSASSTETPSTATPAEN